MFNHHARRIEELERKRRRSNVLRFFEGILIGSAVGVLFGILFAPRPGRDTMDEWSEEARRLYEKGKSYIPVGTQEDDLEDLPEPDEIDLELE